MCKSHTRRLHQPPCPPSPGFTTQLLTLNPTGSSRNTHTHTHTRKVPWGGRAAQHLLVPGPRRPSRAGEPWALWEGLQEPAPGSCGVLRSWGVPLVYRGRVHTSCLDLTGTQSHPTLCHPMDRTSPCSSVPGTLQASIREWDIVSSFKGSSRPRDRTCISCTGRQVLYR